MNLKRIPGNSFWVNVNLFSIGLAIWSCAAEGTAKGGPVDETGPNIIQVSPDSNNTILTGKDKVSVHFDELVDPLTIPASIHTQPEITLMVKTRGKTVEIEPESSWPQGTFVQISLSRTIRDYQSNKMSEQVELYYSTGGEFPQGEISGKIFNLTEDAVVESGLFRLAESSLPEITRKTEADKDGNFAFHHVPDGKYFISCTEGPLSDFSKDIRLKRYGMQSMDSLVIRNGNSVNHIAIWMDEPVKRLEIKSIQFENPEYGSLQMSDGSSIPYTFSIPENRNAEVPVFRQREELTPGDSVFVTLELSNRLEKYRTDPFYFQVPAIQDSVPPEVSKTGYENDQYFIWLTEPVMPVQSDPLMEFFPDSVTTLEVDYQFNDPDMIRVDCAPDTSTTISLYLWKLQDYFGNSFSDSIYTFTINPLQNSQSEVDGGSIKGVADYSGPDSLMVEATQVETGSQYFTSGKTEFYFHNLIPGDYTFKAFELKNSIDPQIYFSGLWDPLQPAARIGVSSDTVEVRKRWIIEGVKIEMK